MGASPYILNRRREVAYQCAQSRKVSESVGIGLTDTAPGIEPVWCKCYGCMYNTPNTLKCMYIHVQDTLMCTCVVQDSSNTLYKYM